MDQTAFGMGNCCSSSHSHPGFLARLTAEGEHDLVVWLRSYERPLPYLLNKKYADVSPAPTYVSFWTGLDGIVPGAGAGSQPAEALHAPWQRQLDALGGSGDVGHVLSVMQKLYKEHWHDWYEWHSDAPLHCSTRIPWTHV